MSRSDRPRTQPEMTSDSNALVRVTPGAEQPRAERLVGAAQLGPLQLDRAHRGLDRRRRLLAVAAAGPVAVVAALVAGPAQELRRPRPPRRSGSSDRTLSRATSSRIEASSRSELNSSSISARRRSIGDTRRATGVGPPSCLAGSREPTSWTPSAHPHTPWNQSSMASWLVPQPVCRPAGPRSRSDPSIAAVSAKTADPTERSRLFPRFVQMDKGYAGYEQRPAARSRSWC